MNLYYVTDYIIDNYMKNDGSGFIQKHLRSKHVIPTLLHPSISETTKQEQCIALGIKKFDYSLPQHLVDEIQTKLGMDISRHAVYCYDDSKFGEVYPITKTGEIILKIWRHMNEPK